MGFLSRTTRSKPPGTVAALDLGSNSFHLVVAQNDHGGLQVVDRMKEMVRLAGGLDEDGNLDDTSRERALACLERFGQRLRDMPRGSVRAVGTNTLRQAGNSRSFLRQAEQALGHPIEVVSGVEEARLVYLGVAHSLADQGGRRLVVDIGGGSTELIVGERFNTSLRESLGMGCVSISKRFFPDDKFGKSAMAAAEEAVLLEMEPVEYRYRQAGWAQVVGTSGTIKAVQAVVREQGWSHDCITMEALTRLREAIQKAGQVKRLRFESLGSDRRPVFAGGVLVLHGVFRSLGIESMVVSDGALREGVLYDLLGRINYEDTRDASIGALARRYHVDEAQAERVQATANQLLMQVAGAWQLDEHAEQRLRWAAWLHEVGLDIAHNQYHLHGGYIAANADMAGFSRQDQALLAILIQGHRRKLQDSLLADLPAEQRRTTGRLIVLLRLAVVLHRGRHEDPMPDLRLSVTNDSLDLRAPADWLDTHPLTVADLMQEARHVSGLNVALSFGAA